MIERTSAKLARELADQFRIVAIIGPRQSGKTTLARSVFGDKAYVNLEEIDTRRIVQEDPRGFLREYREGAVIDEAQRCPDLFSYLQSEVDARPEPGRFILTGSQHFSLLEGMTQSLAGRVGFVKLLPFSRLELANCHMEPDHLHASIYQGGYPPIYDTNASPLRWHDAYITTYVERDVRQIVNVRDIDRFQRFVRQCVGNIGQLANLSRIGADCGIDQKTVSAWLNVLESSFILFRLRPHFSNFRKRLVKTPKLYFYDTGLACRLLGIESPATLLHHSMRGPLFENWAITEWYKHRWNQGREANAYFWRNNTGLEVDLLIDHGDRLTPIEMKSGATIASDWLDEISKWRDLAGKQAGPSTLIYGGDSTRMYKGSKIYAWRDISEMLEEIDV